MSLGQKTEKLELDSVGLMQELMVSFTVGVLQTLSLKHMRGSWLSLMLWSGETRTCICFSWEVRAVEE